VVKVVVVMMVVVVRLMRLKGVIKTDPIQR
jgi:hypothetical protein